MSRFDDYIRDIPMEIGRKFYPRPEVLMPKCSLPLKPSTKVQYDFQVEHNARKAYDRRNDIKEEVKPKKDEETPVNSLPARLGVIEVLQPSKIDNSIIGIPVKPPETAKQEMSFEEFEAKCNVFDEIEWKSIDDKKALSQILNGSFSQSELATSNPLKVEKQETKEPILGFNLPSFPVLSLETNPSTPDINGSKIINNQTVSYSKPSTPTAVTPKNNNSTSSSNKVPLRQRLLTKGYRENLVNAALAKVPQERVVHIEYYMKGMSMLEKKGVPADASLTYLLDSRVTDKQEVLQRATTADQLLGMGFPSEKVFKTLLSSEGDRMRALDILLNSP